MLLASLVRLGPLNFCQTFLNSPFGLVGWIRLEVEDDHLALAVALAARIAELRGAQHFAQGDVLLFSVISLKGCLGGGALLDLKNLFFDAADFPCLFIGLDVGSTTVKAVVVDPVKDEILWQDYQRHETKQPEKVLEFLKRIEAEFLLTHENIRIFVTGSGGGCNLRDQEGSIYTEDGVFAMDRRRVKRRAATACGYPLRRGSFSALAEESCAAAKAAQPMLSVYTGQALERSMLKSATQIL